MRNFRSHDVNVVTYATERFRFFVGMLSDLRIVADYKKEYCFAFLAQVVCKICSRSCAWRSIVAWHAAHGSTGSRASGAMPRGRESRRNVPGSRPRNGAVEIEVPVFARGTFGTTRGVQVVAQVVVDVVGHPLQLVSRQHAR